MSMNNAIPIEYLYDIAKGNLMVQPSLPLDCPPQVFINPDYMNPVPDGYDVITAEGVPIWSRGSTNHPMFESTRRWLERSGYIKVQEAWLNGDRAIKPFFFNNVLMEVGDKFYSAGAWSTKFRQSWGPAEMEDWGE